MPLLELKSITKDFPGVRALDGVSFDLERGEVHALCGENGAGKSTLIKILCGYYPTGTYGGEILLEGKPVHFRNLKEAEEHGIALIAQELALVPELSVAENLLLGREPVKAGLIQWDAVDAEARRALGLVGLAVDPSRPVKELGIGQQQMVEIAKALAKNAALLVLDEPTAALTETDARRLLAFLAELRERGVSSIYISHRLEEVFQIADRITVLRDGRSVATHRAGEATSERVISEMVGREVKNLYPRPDARAGKAMLAVSGWSVEDPLVPGRLVLKDVAFDVHAGEIFGIAGLMGAGRTALLSSVFGAARSPVRGTVQLEGAAPRGPFRSPAEAIASGLALVSEDRKRYGLVLEADVGENLTLATLRQFVKGLFLDHKARQRESLAQFQALRIKAPGLASLVNQLSGGNQQKVVLGKWLAVRPNVLIVDEPTRGIDVGAKQAVYQLLRDLAADGMAILMISSELPELIGMSDRILVMHEGAIAGELPGGASEEAVMGLATGHGIGEVA